MLTFPKRPRRDQTIAADRKLWMWDACDFPLTKAYICVQYTFVMPGLRPPRQIGGAENVATILILENRAVVDQQTHCRPTKSNRQEREFCTNPPHRVVCFGKRRASATRSRVSTSNLQSP